MATFTNFATLSYNGNTINSNTVTGEILDSITATKTAVVDRYNAADTITYVVSLINSDSAAATLTLTDDLGGYDVESYTDLSRALRKFKAGDTVEITVYRSGQEITLTGVLDEKPQDLDSGTTQETAPNVDQMPEDGSYEEWYDYFDRFFGFGD